jgi:hypothetical protein
MADPIANANAVLGQRNRDGTLGDPGQWNDVLETILNHRSVRGFLPRALPVGTLELLIAAAQSASTSSNLQFWSVVAIEETDRKSRLAELAGQQQFIRDAPLLLVWLADLSRLDRIAAEHGASVAELGLPPHVFAVFGMSIGYPDPARETGIKPRLPQSVVLHREQYSVAPHSETIDGYNATMRKFQREQGMRAIDWTEQCFNRVKDAEALRGRDRMREALRNLGFELR